MTRCPQGDDPHPVDDLVFDIGMHQGEDTAYYLAKGYRVVAVEANPELARQCRERFADAIGSGTLTVVEGAIAANAEGPVTFYIDRNSLWGSIDPAWVRKKRVLRKQQAISVPAVDLIACMNRYGTPYYMKIDIEGADRLCLEALRGAAALPAYISMEAEISDPEALKRELELLRRLGYRRFALVAQGAHGEISTRTRSGDRLAFRFPAGSSGPFGEDLRGAWRPWRIAAWHHRWVLCRRQLGRRLGENGLMRRWPIHGLIGLAWERSPGFRRFFTGYYDTHARR